MKRLRLWQGIGILLLSGLIACVIIPTTLCYGYLQALGQGSGRIKGTVKFMIIDELPQARARIILEGVGIRRVVDVTDGHYEIEAPAGVYRISASDPGSCTTIRAAFRLRASTVVTLDLPIVGCAIVDRTPSGRKQHRDEIDKAHKQPKGEVDGEEWAYIERVFETPHFSGMPSELMIRFGKWDEEKRISKYEGTMVKYLTGEGDMQRFLPVMVSFDLLTIYANNVRLDKKSLRLTAEGDVIIDNGGERRRAKRVTINFKAHHPIESIKMER